MHSSLSAMPMFSTVLVLFLGCFAFKGSECIFTEDTLPSGSRNTIQSVAELEANLKGMIFKGVERIAPELMDQIATVTLSQQCDTAFLKLIRGVLEMNDWAFKMLDACGKLSAGVLEGTSSTLGDYDECLNVEMPTKRKDYSEAGTSGDVIRGQYCMLKIGIPDVLRKAAMDYQAGNKSSSSLSTTHTFLRNLVKIAPRADIADMRLGLCLPSPCNIDDVGRMISKLVGDEQELITVLRCEKKEDKELEVQQIVIMAFLGIIAFFVLCGTLIDIILRTMASGLVDDVFFKKQNMYIQFLVAFSLGNNCRKLVKQDTDDGQLSCVRGIRFLIVCLIIFIYTYIMPIDLHFIKYRSAFNIYKFMDQWWFALVANSSVGVDTLFFLAGLQITYKIWKRAAATAENKGSVNLIKFVVVWYSRLTASQLLVIALFLLFPLIGSGPLWADVVIPEVDHCKKTWWMNALYINNFWPGNETCLYHTWVLTSLMYMLIVTPLILLILGRWSIFGVLLILALTLGSCIAVAIVTIVNELPPSPSIYFLSFLNLRMVLDKLFTQAYGHLAPFCIGILTGYLLAVNPKVEFRKVTVIIGWSVVTACELSIIFGLFNYRHGEAIEPALATFYAAIHRLAWAMSFAWIVVSCAYGYGGAVGDFLSWKAFIPLDRLSNFVYLLHPLVMFFHSGQVRERMYMSHLDQVVYSLAYIFLTCILAAFCYVIFFVPYKFLESMIWKSREEGGKGLQHHTVSKVIAIKERISNDFTVTMRNTPGQLVIGESVGGIDNNGFNT